MRRSAQSAGSSFIQVSSGRTKSMRRAALAAAAAVAALHGLTPLSASADTWDGGGANNLWSTGNNWVDNTAPAAGEALSFAGNNQLSNSNDIAAGTAFGAIDFAVGAGSFSLTGNSIEVDGDITNNSGVAQTLNFTTTPFTFNTLTYQQGGLVFDNITSTISNTAGGSLSLGHVTIGNAYKSTGVSTINIASNDISASGLAVQTDSASNNVINIAAGATFSIAGNVTLGAPQNVDIDPDVPIRTNVNFTGTGSLSVTNGNFFVGLGSQNFDGGDRNIARVDMTSLSSFTYNTGPTGTGLFGVGWMTRPDGQLRLSNTANTITADVVGIGNSGITGTNSSPNNSGTTARLFLGGGTNVINADNINVGAVKGAGSIEWDPAVTTGTLTIVGQNGTARANITVGNQTSATGAGAVSTLNLGGGTHSVNILADTIVLGRLGGATGGTIGGSMTFDAGNIDVNTLNIAANVSGSANAVATGIGVSGAMTVNGGSMTINNAFILGNDTNATATGGTQATFTLNNGTVTSNAGITRAVNGGAVNDLSVLNITGGTLNVTNDNIGSATAPLTAINISGGALDNAARIHANNITITNTPTISGTPVFVISAGGTLSSPGLTLNAGQGIEGGTIASPANVTGNVTVNSAGYLDPGTPTAAGILALANDLTLNNNSTVSLDLSNDPGNSDRVTVGGALTLGGTVNLDIGSLATSATVGQTYTVMTYAGALTGDETNFTTGTGGTRKTFTVQPTAGTPGQINLLVGGSGPLNLTYTGTGSSDWQVAGPTNFDSSGPQQFFNLDDTNFTNLSTNLSPVNLVGTLSPSSVNVDASRDYTFSGTGSIAGAIVLTKSGTGTLTVNTNNTYSGGTTINAGVLAIGDGGVLGTGTVSNAGTLRVNRTDVSTLSNVVSGAGVVEHAGVGTTTFTNNKTYTGATNINAGTVVIQEETSLGGTNNGASGGPVTIASGATLDLSGGVAQDNTDFGPRQITVGGTGVGGNGAIVNSGNRQINAFEVVSLSADTLVNTIGTTNVAGRFDIRRADVNIDGVDDLALNGNTLTKIGGGQFSIVTLEVGAGNIVVNEGIFALEQGTVIPATIAGNPAGTITYNNGTTAQWFNNTAAADNSRPMVFNGNVNTGNAGGTAATIDANMTVNGTLNHVTLNNAVGSTTLNGNISGAGALTKSGNTTLTLGGASNTYAGGTTVNGGTLTFVNAASLPSSGPLTVNNTNTTAAGNAVLVQLSDLGPSTSGSLSGTISTPTSGTNTATIDNRGQAFTVNQTTDGTFGGTITGAGSLTKAGASTLTLTGTQTYTGATNVNAGNLQMRRMHEATAVTIASGAKLTVLDSSPTLPDFPSGDNAFISRPASLTIATGGQLDLTNNDLIVDYTTTSPIADIEALVASGFNGGEWNGDGIISTTALNDPNFVLAVAENASLLIPFGDGVGDDPLFSGQVVDDTTVLVKFTHRVDLDLDGLITGNDAAVFNAFYSEGQPATWQFGDLDYDGVYSGNDAAIFNGFYNESLASVPEPAAVGLLGLGALGMLGRRRQRRPGK